MRLGRGNGFLFAGLLALAACSQRPQPLVAPETGEDKTGLRAIKNGEVVTSGLRSVVAILMLDGNRRVAGVCSGTLVTPLFVLTAAHCVADINSTTNRIEDASTSRLMVAIDYRPPPAGTDRLAIPGVTYVSVARVFRNPDYLPLGLFSEANLSANVPSADSIGGADVALLQLAERQTSTPVEFALAHGKVQPTGGVTQATAVGYGLDGMGTGPGETDGKLERKRRGTIVFAEHTTSYLLRSLNEVAQLATVVPVANGIALFEQGPVEEQNPCAGDSGGPALVETGGSSSVKVLYGVLSFGPGTKKVCNTGVSPPACNFSLDPTPGRWHWEPVLCSEADYSGYTRMDSEEILGWHDGVILANDPPPGACVSPPDGFKTHTSGCRRIADGVNNLIWSSKMPADLPLAAAKAACEALIVNTYRGWRLPTRDQARALASVDGTRVINVPRQLVYRTSTPGGSGTTIGYNLFENTEHSLPDAQPAPFLCVRDP